MECGPISLLVMSVALMAASAEATEWRIGAVNGIAVQGETQILFEDDGSMSGTTDCNRFQGRGAIEGGTLVVAGPLATTRMACPGDALTAQDDTVLALLQGEVAVIRDPAAGTGITLFRDGATMTLAMVSNPGGGDNVPPVLSIYEAAYLNVFGVSDALNIRAEPSTAAPVVSRVRSGTLLESSGCEDRTDRVWCQVKLPVASAKAGWAAAEFLEPATAALRAAEGVFDQIGRLPCSQAAGAPMAECEFGVARDRDGTAVVVVFGVGADRILTFRDGTFAFADTSEDGGGSDASASIEGQTHSVSVGEESYQVPHDLIASL